MSPVSKFSVLQRRKAIHFPQCINVCHSENGELL